MTFPHYPRYKQSGAEWLGQVPEHWSVRRLGYYFSERREKVSDRDFPPLSVTKEGIVPQLETAAKSDDGDNRRKVLKGDFVINSRSDRRGSSGLADRDGSVSLICTVLKPHDFIGGSFAHHLFRSFPFQEEYYRYGKGIVADLWSTNYSEMRNILIACPPEHEQQLIATFLDHQTSTIDALIAEQQRLIELLNEKRQAVISRTVTKGLNPSAPMKPSGTEWFGDVPEHWRAAPIKRCCDSITDGAHISPETEDGVYPFVSTKDVYGGKIDLDHCLRTSEASFQYMLKTGCRPFYGDVLFSKDGTIGETVVVTTSSIFVVASSLIIIRPSKKYLNAAFLRFLCQSGAVIGQVEAFVKGAGLPRLSIQNLKRVLVPVPPIEEQLAIAEYLESTIRRFDALITEAQHGIDLLQERRSALISAAVTGQIDVRGLVSRAVA